MSTLKRQLEASVMLERLGAAILVGEQAIQAFDENGEAQLAEVMRRQNAEAFARLNELLIWLKREHEGDLL